MKLFFSLLLIPGLCRALIFYDAADPAANAIAPTGDYADAGWQCVGRYGSFHATMISPKHILTAKHFGSQGNSFIQSSLFSGTTTKTYTIKNRVSLSGSDFTICEIWETFDKYMPLYTSSNEVGRELVITGAGRGRGAEVTLGSPTPTVRGWRWGANDDRWGRNTVQGAITDANSPVSGLLFFDFSPIMGVDECQAANFDSGGPWFIKDPGPSPSPIDDEWKLAAISYAVDGSYDTNNVVDTNEFSAALFDARGFYYGRDTPSPSWNLIPVVPNPMDQYDFYAQSHTYGSRVSEKAATIQGMIQDAIDNSELTPTEYFENWITDQEATQTDLALDDDPDKDGFSNLEEFFTDSNPSDANDLRKPLSVAELNSSTNQLTLVAALDLEGRDLTWDIQYSNSLDSGDWADLSLPSVTPVRNAAEGTQTLTFTHAPGVTGAAFYRVKITATF